MRINCVGTTSTKPPTKSGGGGGANGIRVGASEDHHRLPEPTTATRRRISTTTTTPLRCKVAIVGAGASGLQCAQRLVQEYGLHPHDLILLEARSRIGGRIYSTLETRQNVDTVESTQFYLDHGAAWVHGTGFDWLSPVDGSVQSVPMENPMMRLLQQEASTRNKQLVLQQEQEKEQAEEQEQEQDDHQEEEKKMNHQENSSSNEKPQPQILQQETVYDNLRPIFSGNPWMRPRTVVHEPNQIVLFLQGQRLESASVVIQEAMKRHFWIFHQVNCIGEQMFDQGQGMETTLQSLQQTIETVVKEQDQSQAAHVHCRPSTDLTPQQQQQVMQVTPFYQHLLECWYGAPASELQLCEFTEDVDRVDDIGGGGHEDQSYSEEGDFFGPHCTVKRGMQSVLVPLLQNGVAEQVHTDQPVVQIRQHRPRGSGKEDDDKEDGCLVLTTASGWEIRADCSVVTVPAGCLKKSRHGAKPL